MDLASFNALSVADAAAMVRPCADVDAWVDTVVAGRPYDTKDALFATADAAARRWTGQDVDAALAGHPRIGERAPGDAVEARMSRREQPTADERTAAAIAAGNRRYEERFGRIFLVRAAGRDAEEILALLTARLDNDPGTEDAVTAGELREIAMLRLAELFEPARESDQGPGRESDRGSDRGAAT